MKLAELNPEFVRGSGEKGYLTIDCPRCRTHRFTINTLDSGQRDGVVKCWGFKGNPPDWDSVTITPSVGLNGRIGDPPNSTSAGR
jgi:predicted Zn finger-like uncharacterized protein